MIMSGSSHVVSTSKGADRGSEKNIGDILRLFSLNWFRSGRLIRLISRL